jgi:CheY-like chemotaxis protein
MAVIMVVDDEPEVRQLMETIIVRAGHEVVSAADASHAWSQLDRRPRAIFVDIDMPGETGVELVLRLREHPDHADVPVAFVTAYRERARPLVSTGAAGIVDVIDKPFRMEAITDCLRRMLEPDSPGGLTASAS